MQQKKTRCFISKLIDTIRTRRHTLVTRTHHKANRSYRRSQTTQHTRLV